MKYCWFTRFFCCNEKRPEPRMSVVTKAPTGITALKKEKLKKKILVKSGVPEGGGGQSGSEGARENARGNVMA
jgi:hypothetical protein